MWFIRRFPAPGEAVADDLAGRGLDGSAAGPFSRRFACKPRPKRNRVRSPAASFPGLGGHFGASTFVIETAQNEP